MTQDHLKALSQIVEPEKIFACIRDLVSNGLDVRRFSTGESVPDRQEVTHFLATWIGHFADGSEKLASWLSQYSVDVLSEISSSSQSSIRHSAKSVLKYAIRESIPFVCFAEHNGFKAACDVACRFYKQQSGFFENQAAEKPTATAREIRHVLIRKHIKEKLSAEMERQRKQKSLESERNSQSASLRHKCNLRKRDLFKEAFDRSLKIVEAGIAAGKKPREILKELRDGDHKTRTGRAWTSSNLSVESRRLRLAKSEIGGKQGGLMR